MNALTSHFPIIADPAQLAGAGPFTLSCVGEVTAHAPDLGSYPQQVTILLGRFRRFAEAFACAKRRGRQPDLCVDTLSGFTPNLLIIKDGCKRLCLAGQIARAGPVWCEPVASDTEARQVVLEACQIRSQAMLAMDQGAPAKAQTLRFHAAVLEARLVDPVWRGQPLEQAQAA